MPSCCMNFEKDTFYEKDGKTYVQGTPGGHGNPAAFAKTSHLTFPTRQGRRRPFVPGGSAPGWQVAH